MPRAGVQAGDKVRELAPGAKRLLEGLRSKLRIAPRATGDSSLQRLVVDLIEEQVLAAEVSDLEGKLQRQRQSVRARLLALAPDLGTEAAAEALLAEALAAWPPLAEGALAPAAPEPTQGEG